MYNKTKLIYKQVSGFLLKKMGEKGYVPTVLLDVFQLFILTHTWAKESAFSTVKI